ncbi:DUF5946 family protein [Streptomyces lasalocidi]|uniref:Uncharacterized protein n=1 Tax=Streptomyces lasalocidi TaxID=324833 RepID=A0A4U5W3X2_STRLS|nr:DUF5946 family protein [Streptomyces lasalocidi]TKS96126.1 hypothetical protein E4U91_35740 [Streptomyces lasalocidi]
MNNPNVDPHSTRQCLGCQGQVPDVEGPVHPYMRASPGCWQWYGELLSEWLTPAAPLELRMLHVDCFAAQHPAGAENDRRQNQSVAVHLTALCLFHEYGIAADRIPYYRKRTSQAVLPRLGLPDWPHLREPDFSGTITVSDLYHDRRTGETRLGVAWPRDCWQAWAPHHSTVRRWAEAVLEGTA